MPIYEFISSDGDVIEQFFSMEDAPPIGSTITVDGVEYERVFTAHIDRAGVHRKVHQYPYVSNALPRNLDHLGETDPKGKLVVRSQRHEKEVASALDMVKGL